MAHSTDAKATAHPVVAEEATQATDAQDTVQHSVLNSTFPVMLPKDATLFLPEDQFKDLLKQTLQRPDVRIEKEEEASAHDDDAMKGVQKEGATKAPFLEGLERHAAHHQTEEMLAAKNQTLTQNADVTNISSKNPLVDLYADLGQVPNGEQLRNLIDGAWKEDALFTLKIIFNARSIHLGKSDRTTAYKALGWLAENHPITLLTNLKWLVRPVIAKKTEKEKDAAAPKADGDEDFDMVDVSEGDPEKAFDVRYGVAHGYWKDLLNLVVFAANDQLKVNGDPASLLNIKADDSKEAKRKRVWDQQSAKEMRQQKKKEQNERVQQKLKDDPFYRALHFTVARLFAAELKEDKALLDSGNPKDLKKLSLASKWAPTFGEFHDKHTFILSSIAEILYPNASEHCPEPENRELYLRCVRELYRKQYASPLRKALQIVERDIAAKTYENIKYDRVPSLAMDRYSGLFMDKDLERFKTYVQNVTKGNARISGATLLPSTLVSKARSFSPGFTRTSQSKNFKAMQNAIQKELLAEVINGQWNTIVKRIKDAGTLQSSLAVCDVSGSMTWTTFTDGSCPMDTSIGLSLLIAEVTAPPFGGGFITFSERPRYISLAGTEHMSFVDKVDRIQESEIGGSTNFVSVFEDLILPMAIENKISQEDMVKQVFVFSDMQFNLAEQAGDRWTTSYDRIKKKYSEAGYEMPRLIFWNLADASTSKPTTMDDVDTALVSGYSQGMLRGFLESGAFDEEVEVEGEEVVGEEEDGAVKITTKKKPLDPLSVARKQLNQPAYSMLEVVD